MRRRRLAPGDETALIRIPGEPEVAKLWGQPEAYFPGRSRHASVDVFLDPRIRGRGIGTEALNRVVRHLVEVRGHHRLTVDPAPANLAAIRSYA